MLTKHCRTCAHWRVVVPERGACTQQTPAIRTIAGVLSYCYPITKAAHTCPDWANRHLIRLVTQTVKRVLR